MSVLSRVLPFFALIAVGLLLGRMKKLDETVAKGLPTYVLWVGFPALLIHSLSHAPPPSLAMAGHMGVYLLAAASPLALVPLIGRALGWTLAERSGVGMASSVGNTAFLGGPLAVAVFGAQAGPLAAQIIAVDFVIIVAIAVAGLQMAQAPTSPWRALGRALTNPIVAAAAIGVGLSVFKITLPAFLDQAIGLAGATGSPVGLVALGLVIGLEGRRPSPTEALPVLVAMGLKLLLVPALVWCALNLMGAEPLFIAVATLMAACPTAVNVFIQTRTHGVFEKGAAQAVAIGTGLSVISLTALAGLLAAWLT
jgi:predicted permease